MRGHGVIAYRAMCVLTAIGCALLCAACAAPVSAPAAAPTLAPEPAPERTPEPTPEPEPTPTPAPTPFSVVWMSDTQNLSEAYPEVFASMTRWIAASARALNLVYVIHTGDVVQTSRVERQWQNAIAALDTLWDADIPVFITAGNHDVAASKRDYTAYIANIASRDNYVKYDFGKGSRALFSAGGTDFLLVGMGCYCIRQEGAVEFLNEQLEAAPDRVAILCTHSYLHKNGALGGEGPIYFSQVVEPNPNVRLTLSGHMRGAGMRISELDDDGDGAADRTVHQMLANYQNIRSGGYLRILRFDPATRDIRVTTYSPWLGEYNAFEDGRDEFVLENAF